MSFETLDTQAEPLTEPNIAVPHVAVPSEKRRGWIRKVVVACVICGIASSVAWKIHANLSDQEQQPGRRGSKAADRPIAVIAVPVQQQAMPIYLRAPGTVTPYYSVTVRSRVDGQLLVVNIREGQQVREGQLLALIDPAPFQASVAQEEGQLAKDQATAVYTNAAAERMRSLFAAGVVSKDREQTSVASAGQAEGAILADKAAIQAAKVNLGFTRIVSPIDGVVGLRQVDPGNIVHASDATGLFLITQQRPIAVVFAVPEDQLPTIQAALRSETQLGVEAYDHAESVRLASGKLLTLDNEIDTATGTDRVKAVFENKDGALFPNQFVNVRLILREEKNAVVIPSSAVQTGSAGSFVYVAARGGNAKNKDDARAHGGTREHPGKSSDDSAEPRGSGDAAFEALRVTVRPISIEATESSAVIVSNGLHPGEQVVIDGFEKLKEGSLVSLRVPNAKQGGRKENGAPAEGEHSGSHRSSRDSGR